MEDREARIAGRERDGGMTERRKRKHGTTGGKRDKRKVRRNKRQQGL